MTIDPKTIAADIMCGNARFITPAEVWAHIGQAYDATEIDASIADEVATLIAKTGIDLIWPDGSKDTELDAARVEIERWAAQVADLADKLHKANAEIDSLTKAGTAWANENAELREVVEAIDSLLAVTDGDPLGDRGIAISLGEIRRVVGEARAGVA